MARRRKRLRFVVRRGSRRYVVCGATARPPGRRSAWLPGATLVIALIASAFFFNRPLVPPDDPQHEMPLAQYAHYSIEDFVQAVR